MVEDVTRTVQFYRDVLGFELVAAFPRTGPFAWALMRRGSVELVFEARASLVAALPGLAVMPFTVSGEGSDVWREGMVDLLSTNLDGVAGLRTIDPATILARLRVVRRELGEGVAGALNIPRHRGEHATVVQREARRQRTFSLRRGRTGLNISSKLVTQLRNKVASMPRDSMTPQDQRPYRSVLYIPASRPRARSPPPPTPRSFSAPWPRR